jgi:hypothetical protein
MRRACASLLAGAIAVAAGARAQEPGFSRRAPNVVALDNLAGVANWRRQVESAGTTSVQIESSVGESTQGGILFYGGSAGPATRLGYHRFVGHGVSLGIGLHYASYSLGASLSTFAAAPRLGLAFPFSELAAIWARAGVTYVRTGMDAIVVKQTSNEMLAGGELLLVLTPAPNVGITIGPTAELGVFGRERVDLGFAGMLGPISPSVDTEVRSRLLAAAAGLVVDF